MEYEDGPITLDPTTTFTTFSTIDAVPCTPSSPVPSMNDDFSSLTSMDELPEPPDVPARASAARPCPLSQRGQQQRRRPQAQPERMHSTAVLCYPYLQGRVEAADETQWQGHRAHLHYFLPENWSPSYKFTVFEDSYVLSFACADGETWPPAYHLGRPLHGPRATEGGAPTLPEFELVWPVELDPALLETIEATCDRVVPGAKRKPQEAQPLALHNVHMKMMRLTVAGERI